MPLVNVKVVEGCFSDAQKRELVKGITDAVASVAGEGLRQVIWVLLEEVRAGGWNIGGKAITADDVNALAAGKQPQ